MKTLYIHIGTMKTGTTAIQLFLDRNREYLHRNNFDFPIGAFEYPEKHRSRNAIFLSFPTKTNGQIDEELDKSIINQDIAIIDECFSKYDNVILTEETSWGHITTNRKWVWDKLVNHFHDMGVKIKVIVYLRRQDAFVESFWKQQVKNNKYRWSLEKCIEKRGNRLQLEYFSNLEEIAADVGEENIIVRRYQREDLIENDAVIDFLSALNLPIDEVRDKILNTGIKNTSISNNATSISKELNKIPNLTLAQSRRFKKYLRIISEGDSKRKHQYSMLTVDEAKAFVGQYQESNNKVVEKYIKDGKPLFNDVYTNAEKWKEDNPYYLNDIIRFTGTAINDLLDKIEEQEYRIKKLEERGLYNKIKKHIKHK